MAALDRRLAREPTHGSAGLRAGSQHDHFGLMRVRYQSVWAHCQMRHTPRYLEEALGDAVAAVADGGGEAKFRRREVVRIYRTFAPG